MTSKEIAEQLLKKVLDNIAAAWETARKEDALPHDFHDLFAKLLGPECEEFVDRIERSLMTDSLNWLGDSWVARDFRYRLLQEHSDEIVQKLFYDKLLEVHGKLIELNEQLDFAQERMLSLEAENMGLRELIAKLQAGGEDQK